MSRVSFTAEVESARGGGHVVEFDLGVHKATLAAAERDTGDMVAITMSVDAEPRERDR